MQCPSHFVSLLSLIPHFFSSVLTVPINSVSVLLFFLKQSLSAEVSQGWPLWLATENPSDVPKRLLVGEYYDSVISILRWPWHGGNRGNR